MSDNLGSGPLLDENFDLEIGPTGDIGSGSGLDELQKDLAVLMVINLSRFKGTIPVGNTIEKVKVTARSVALADDRVDEVIQNSVSVDFGERNETITIDMRIRTINSAIENELVFEV